MSKLGEELDEVTPHRQWVRSIVTMKTIDTMGCLRKYKNGTQAKLVTEVKSIDPNVLTSTVHTDDIISVFTCKRIKENGE